MPPHKRPFVKKSLSKANNAFEKYQPTLSFFGTIVAIGISLFALYQTGQDHEISKREYYEKYQPNWAVKVKSSDNSILSDKITFISKNEHINIEKVEISLVNKIFLRQYSCIGIEWDNFKLKNDLIEIVSEHFTDCCMYFSSTGDAKYPISVKFYYNIYGEKRDTTAIYNYHFKAYFAGQKVKIRTLGLEFLNYIDPNNIEIGRHLTRQTLTNSFLTDIPNYNIVVKSELVKQDTLYSHILDFVNLNLKMGQDMYHIAQEGETSNIGKVFGFIAPVFLANDSLYNARNQIIHKINASINAYDDRVVQLCSKIDRKTKEFEYWEPMSYLKSLNNDVSCIENNQIINEGPANEWKNLNQELLNILYSKVEI